MNKEVAARNYIRRRLAEIFTAGALFIIFAVVGCLFFDPMADRLLKVGPTLAWIFPAIMLYLGHYTHVGSSENKAAMNKENPAWAPDSLHLVYNTDKEEEGQLFLINLYQKEPVQITKGSGQKRFASWETRNHANR